MIYIEKLHLPSLDSDWTDSNLNYTHKSAYPFHVLSQQGLFDVFFRDITIVVGGNGAGKSTLLNIIAQKLKLRRHTAFNNTAYFEEYLKQCSVEKSLAAYQLPVDIADYGRIITSDEVFDYMIETRQRNDEIDRQRSLMLKEIDTIKRSEMPSHIDLTNQDSVKEYLRL